MALLVFAVSFCTIVVFEFGQLRLRAGLFSALLGRSDDFLQCSYCGSASSDEKCDHGRLVAPVHRNQTGRVRVQNRLSTILKVKTLT